MSELSRRGFLKASGGGLVAAGVIAAAPVSAITAASAASNSSKQTNTHNDVHAVATTQTVVVHIPNPRSGELRFMVGEKEVVRHDRSLVARLIRDIR
jgi:secreted PhoX family phosphatase